MKMKLLLENWKSYINESKKGVFYVDRRKKKIRGKTHYVIMHRPSGTYVPSDLYKMEPESVQGLADELNAYNAENEGIFDDPDLPSNEQAMETALEIIRNSPHREGSLEF
jgi:hypothetical protein